ncbi:MAG TPA: hypothetical protein VGQ07_02885 [Nitrospirales bacterium]|nr:hypothetical protein [Nitrospirales bacterium]
MTVHRGRQRLKDVFLYVVIGVIAVMGAELYAVHQARSGGSPTLPLKWMGFAALTVLVFGYLIRRNRPNWRKRSFWGILSLCVCVHAGLGWVVLKLLVSWPLIMLGPIAGVEYFVLAAVLTRVSSVGKKGWAERTSN